jgi:hypothetical protein
LRFSHFLPCFFFCSISSFVCSLFLLGVLVISFSFGFDLA